MPTRTFVMLRIKQPPNKRLKLAGDDRFKGNGVLCPWRATDFVPHPCARERVARSLSEIGRASCRETEDVSEVRAPSERCVRARLHLRLWQLLASYRPRWPLHSCTRQ